MKRYSINMIKTANRQAGHFFFSPDTMRMFHSIIYPATYHGADYVFFVTSERYVEAADGPRVYQVRTFDPATGQILPSMDNRYSTLEEAQARASALAAGAA